MLSRIAKSAPAKEDLRFRRQTGQRSQVEYVEKAPTGGLFVLAGG